MTQGILLPEQVLPTPIRKSSRFFLKPVSRWIRLAPIQAMDLMESEMRVFVRSGTGGAWLEGIKESGWYRDEIRP